MNLLFVCTENLLRSATAETVFSQYTGVEAIGAGTNADSATVVSGDLIEWADFVFVMEASHRNKVTKKFRSLLGAKRVIVLGIADDYGYLDPGLVALLKRRVAGHVPALQR